MNAFQEWLKTNSVETGYLYDTKTERQREKGWQAALKEVLKQMTKLNTKEDIINWIEEELGEGS